jgi:CcmD family protein
MRIVNAARVLVLCLVLGSAAPSIQAQQPPRTTAAQDGFVPVDTLPPGDTLPAAPLLVAAYAVAWLAIMLYLWSVWRRLSRVESELAALGRRVAEPERRGGAR